MGRELKRVPLDFDWPIGTIWSGYQSPPWRPCPAECENGSTVAAAWLGAITHLILMTGDASIEDRPLHPWLRDVALAPARRPGPEMADLTEGLAGRAPRPPFGHDAIDRWAATNAIIKAAGLPEDWGTCPTCKGHAIHPDDIEPSDKWERTDPPEGEGYQLWGTTSEGEPLTPVFDTLDALCEYAAENCTVFARDRATAAEWKRMLDSGLVASEYADAKGNRVMFL